LFYCLIAIIDITHPNQSSPAREAGLDTEASQEWSQGNGGREEYRGSSSYILCYRCKWLYRVLASEASSSKRLHGSCHPT